MNERANGLVLAYRFLVDLNHCDVPPRGSFIFCPRVKTKALGQRIRRITMAIPENKVLKAKGMNQKGTVNC